MAMDPTVLAALMRQKIDALSDRDKADRNKTYEALADAVITHIRAAAQISGAAGVGLIAPSGAVTGSVILPPGSIT
jgi:hypothetical protein